eukprot:5190855-Ditylum_brightwellii.AAC.1
MSLSTASYSEEEVKAKFVTKKVTCIEGKPTYETITKLKEEIYANVAAVPTTSGGGQHDHTNPKEPTQPMFAPNTTDAVKVKKLGGYKEAQRIYNNHHTVDRALKQQIKAAVEKKYLEELSEPLVWYMNISGVDMIDHQLDQYGDITLSDVRENNERMNEPMDIDEPISTYFIA